MNYNQLFSDDVFSFMNSPSREILKRVKCDNIYSFSGGYPNATTFPIEKIKNICSEILDNNGPTVLQYGSTQGVDEFLSALSNRYGVPKDNIQITSSSQQGIDVCARILLNPGDIVLTLNPSYFGAIQSFMSYRARIVSLHDATEEELSKAKMCYIIPEFQNPTGETLTLEQRKEIIELSRKYDFIIIEDSPYRELRFEGEDVATMYSLAPERVLHLGSLSKIFVPGFRLGWIFGPTEVLKQINICKQSLDLSASIFNQHIAAEYINKGFLNTALPQIVDFYRDKRDLMLSLLEKYMPANVTWTHPHGGLFLFLYLPQNCDTIAMYANALDSGVAYVPGSYFYIDGSHRNTMRLNYSFVGSDRMEEGIKILSEVVKRYAL